MRRTRILIVFFLLVYSFVTRATEFDGVQSITGDSATPNALTSMGNNALAVKRVSICSTPEPTAV